MLKKYNPPLINWDFWFILYKLKESKGSMSELDKININFNEKYKNVKTKEDLQNLKSEFFGKNGIITSQFKSLNSLSPDKKKRFGLHYKSN